MQSIFSPTVICLLYLSQSPYFLLYFSTTMICVLCAHPINLSPSPITSITKKPDTILYSLLSLPRCKNNWCDHKSTTAVPLYYYYQYDHNTTSSGITETPDAIIFSRFPVLHNKRSDRTIRCTNIVQLVRSAKYYSTIKVYYQ